MKRMIILATMMLVLSLSGCSAKEQTAGSAATVRVQNRGSGDPALTLPPGFRIGLFASALDGPRLMAISPDGRLFATEMDGGRVTILPDANGDGKADSHVVYANGLNRPHGIVFHDGYLYIAETTRVIRYPYRNGDTHGSNPETIISGLPTGGHFTRTITFGHDGYLYLSVGWSCNVCIERNPLRAAISRYNADGSGRRILATGLRNSVGLAWNPSTGDLWATENGRDYLGDNIPPEEVNVIREGGFYGWPYAYGNRVPDPEYGTRAPAKVRASIPPRIAMQAHSAPLGLTFYSGAMFPQDYQGGLFIAFHGSWNRSVPTGYKVVWFRMRGGNPVGAQHDFITGRLQGRQAWGRPVDVLTGPHGEIFVTDDSGGRVYRVTYGR